MRRQVCLVPPYSARACPTSVPRTSRAIAVATPIVGFAMRTASRGFQARNRGTAQTRLSLLAFLVLAIALPQIFGCLALTQPGSSTSKPSSGSAAAGALTASAATVNFGNVAAGSSSLQTVTLTNTGAASVTISEAAVTGSSFGLVGSMSAVSIAAGRQHSFQIRFSPTISGSDSGSVTIASDAKNSNLDIRLGGTATAGLAISAQPASKTVTAGQTATFSVVAAGPAPLAYQWKKSGAAISGATSATYTTPPTTTSESGESFTVTVNGSGEDDNSVTSNPAMLTVDASPSTLTASKTSLDFPNVNVGAGSVLPVAFTNTGNSEITISNVVVAGAGYTAGGVESGQILAPGQTGTLDVTFDPSGTGTLSGSLTVTSSAANSPARIALSGTGVQAVQHSATLSWTDADSTVTGYNLYRSTVSGGPYIKLDSALVAATTSTDTAVQAGRTYYYVVTSVDASGVESAYSTEASATIP